MMNVSNFVKLGMIALVLTLVSACASDRTAHQDNAIPKQAPLSESSNSIPLNAQKDLTVLDAIVAITSGATRPEIGAPMVATAKQIVSDGGLIIERSEYLIIARFSMENSKAITDYEYCDLEYRFNDAGLEVGPIVIGDCTEATIKGTRVN